MKRTSYATIDGFCCDCLEPCKVSALPDPVSEELTALSTCHFALATDEPGGRIYQIDDLKDSYGGEQADG
jgi:hypothetical protein